MYDKDKNLMKRVFVKYIVIAAVTAAVASCYKVDFVPTPVDIVDRMLELAKVTEKDLVYDLGSGDGRIVIAAAKKYGARGVGIELPPALVELARAKVVEQGVANLVRFEVGDVLKANISSATVVTLFLGINFNAWLRPLLEQQLKPGTRIVSHEHPIPGWEPAVSHDQPLSARPGRLIHLEVIGVQPLLQVEEKSQVHTIYLWKID
jgi:SAM-dependent methyltransferase